MLARLRLAVPDRPGSLGRVATALGAAGADIVRVEVLDSEAGRAVDDVHVTVHDLGHLGRLHNRLAAVPGVEILGVQHPAPPPEGHAELELVGRVVARPEAAAQTLVDGAPHAVGADWAALLEYGPEAPRAVLATSPGCPDLSPAAVRVPLRLTALSVTGPGATTPYGGAALAPLGSTGMALLVVREGGPTFHRSELGRLGQIGAIAGSVLRSAPVRVGS